MAMQAFGGAAGASTGPIWQFPHDAWRPGIPGIYDYWEVWCRPLDDGEYPGLPNDAARRS
jgi:hypothetical protein